MAKKKSLKNSSVKSSSKKSNRRKTTSLARTSFKRFKIALLERRSLLIGDIRKMEQNAAVPAKSFEEDGMFEREILFGLIESQEAAVRDIDEALKRIEEKTFGICVQCNEPIGEKRLLAKPSSKLCLNCRVAYEKETYGTL